MAQPFGKTPSLVVGRGKSVTPLRILRAVAHDAANAEPRAVGILSVEELGAVELPLSALPAAHTVVQVRFVAVSAAVTVPNSPVPLPVPVPQTRQSGVPRNVRPALSGAERVVAPVLSNATARRKRVTTPQIRLHAVC